MAFAASAPATSGGAISTSFTSDGATPFSLSAFKRISRSSENRLGMAIACERSSETLWRYEGADGTRRPKTP